MDSRVLAVVNSQHPTLFHSTLGQLNPLAVSLRMGSKASSDPSVDAATMDAVLLHEQHHWLQHLGTSAGIFNMLLLEVQASFVASTVDLSALSISDLPLTGSAAMSHHDTVRWHRLESTRMLFFGSRTDDFISLQDAGLEPEITELPDLLWPVTRRIPATGPVEVPSGPLRSWGATGSPIAGWPEAVTSGRHLVGSSHVMEGAARVNEIVASSLALDSRVDPSMTGQLHGPYRVAWDMAYPNVDFAGPGQIFTFLYLCDLALCGAWPPAFPPSGPYMHPRWTPGAVFSTLADLARSCPPVGVDFSDVDSLDAARETLDTYFSITPMIELRRTVLAGLSDLLAGYELDEMAETAFALVEDIPAPRGEGSRFRYLLALANAALELRQSDPLMMIAPAAVRHSRPSRFREALDRLPPPLVDLGGYGLAASHPRKGWAEYFLMGAVEYELLRGIVTKTPDQLVDLLVPYAQTEAGVEHGAGWIAGALHHALRGSSLASELSRQIWRRTVEAGESLRAAPQTTTRVDTDAENSY